MKIIVKKRHKRKIKKANKFLSSINLGFYGIKAGFIGFVNQRQVETARLILTRLTKKVGRIFIRIHFFIGLTKKALTSRMGKGIGIFKEWVVLIKKGNMLFEVSNVSWVLMKLAFKVLKCWFSLPIYLLRRVVLLK